MHQGRLAEQSFQRRDRRFGTHHAALALEAFQHGGFLTAHIRARALDDAHIEGPTRAHHVIAQPPVDARDIDRGAQGSDRRRVFRSHIDQPEARPDGGSRDRHTFEQREGVTLHQHAIGKGATVALVGVAAHVLDLTGGLLDGAPLDPGRESGATAPAQAGGEDVVGHLRGRLGQGAPQANQTAESAVFVKVQGVGQADPGEAHPLLAGQPRNLLDQAVPQCMRAAVEQTGLDQFRDVTGFDWSVSDATGGGLNFDEGFQPEHAAGSVADHLDGDSPGCGQLDDPRRDIVGAHRTRRRVTGNIDAHAHRGTTWALTTAARTRPISQRPTSRPLTMTAGPSAQLPRQ